ncbi:Cmx/CmrA family chloramphenicol efflux MFS transporter [Nocardia pseudobrasiliensis]|uniref:DHA1 family chloramphenicol resistance protein-like MFS transporter n=1 Tax=Nocardia pseudobrasiliensis TaxID=45979 RepID=A0A370HWZ2_9NOCA|nr:Cmx/CmrA family chloramphenicol efflux MFS transporter [Nocardia pseudobrasiliensis]RDI63008.1 DHA1 family chloramphenicol resistance protein-like MFS transporter [Nocardia pseudobrasiliensis]
MPSAVYILGLSIFAQGASELIAAGLLPDMSSDLGVSIPQAGLLISAFALGMLFGAPILAVATMRWSRRTALIAFLAVFILAHVAAVLTSDYRVLFATRVIAAFVYAGFWSVGAAAAVTMVADNERGRAMSIVAGGLTVATIVGLPAGTFIGQHLGWRAAFWAVTILCAIAMVGVLLRVPDSRPATTPELRKELRAMASGQVALLYGITTLAIAGLMATFGYLGALLIETTRVAPGWVPVLLAVYGIGAFLGIGLGGRTADAYPMRTLVVGITGLTVTSALLALSAAHIVPVAGLVFLLGAFGFGTNPVSNSRIYTLAPAATTLGPAGNVVSFNIGITLGPWLGGLALGAGLGYPAIAWISAALGLAALSLVGWSRLLTQCSETIVLASRLAEVTN